MTEDIIETYIEKDVLFYLNASIKVKKYQNLVLKWEYK